jgi:hypothetical protein
MFKKINVLTDKISVSNGDFSKAINSKKKFGIDVEGKIFYEKSPEVPTIFWGRPNLLMKNKILGSDYKVSMTFAKMEISLENSWSRILELNQTNALYDDDHTEGIDHFKDEELEKLAWYGVEFEVNTRDIVTELERVEDGYILALEREIPDYTFHGLGFLKKGQISSAREKLFSFVKAEIEKKIDSEKAEYERFGFSDEESEALQYFGIK